MTTSVTNMGGFNAIHGGGRRGCAVRRRLQRRLQRRSADRSDADAVISMLGVFSQIDQLSDNLSAAWLGSQVLR